MADAFGQHWQKCALGCLITPAHLPAPSPMKRHGPCSRYSAKLFSSMIAGAVSVIWVKDFSTRPSASLEMTAVESSLVLTEENTAE